MVEWISGTIAIALLICHKHYSSVKGSSDVQTGMASAMFWLVFMGAGWVNSAGSPTDINFYLFLAGFGMVVIMLISSLNTHPNQETKIEQKERAVGKGTPDSWRKRMGWHQKRAN